MKKEYYQDIGQVYILLELSVLILENILALKK